MSDTYYVSPSHLQFEAEMAAWAAAMSDAALFAKLGELGELAYGPREKNIRQPFLIHALIDEYVLRHPRPTWGVSL